MACNRIDDLLTGYDGMEDHAARCPECRAWLEAFAEVDSTLTQAFAGTELHPRVRIRIDAQIRPVPFLPALLDLAGGISILAVLTILAMTYAPHIDLDLSTILAIASVSIAASLALAWRALARA